MRWTWCVLVPETARVRRHHLLLALLVVVLWGLSFVVIDLGLRHFPPLLFAALRFTFVAVPGVFLVRRPKVAVGWLVAVGLCLGVGQFGLLFLAMSRGLPAGIASLVLQSQALFTVLFAAAAMRERPGRGRLLGVLVASLGLVVIALGRGAATPLVPLLLAVAAGASWAAGNIATRLARPDHGLGLLVWASLIPPLPLLAMSVLVEGPRADIAALTSITPAAIGALGYVVVLATLVGFGGWTLLLRRYPASTVAPLSLLVPVVGIGAAWLILGEVPKPMELAGMVVVLGGLLLVSTRSQTTRDRGAVPQPSVAELAPAEETA